MIGRRISLGVLSAIVFLATACGASSDPAVRADGSVDLTKVTLNVGDQKGTGLQALLQAAGELKDVAYHIDWSEYTAGPPMLEAINSGSVDFGGVGNAPPVFAAAAGSALKIVGGYSADVGGQAIVVPPDSPLRTPADLRGKKIAVTRGSSADHDLLTVLQRNGLSFHDITPEYLQPADALAALSSGRVDAWAIWDPYTAQAQVQTGARILVGGSGYVPGDSFWVASDQALASKSRTAALRDLLVRIQHAQAWANAHPEQWAQTFAQVTGLSPTVIAVVVPRDKFAPLRLDAAVIADEQQVADLFASAGLIPGTVSIRDYVDTGFDVVPHPQN
jgi:sulfonate transport system substrate-binding protein